jgi:membrane protein required for colicin V production
MAGSGLTWFDAAAGVVVLVSAVHAYRTGVIREIFSIVAFVLAAIAAIFLTAHLGGIVERMTALPSSIATLGTGLVLFLVVFILIKMFGGKLALTADRGNAGNALDRSLGLGYGIVRGVLIVALLIVALRMLAGDPEQSRHKLMPESITRSATFPLYDAVADKAVKLADKMRG